MFNKNRTFIIAEAGINHNGRYDLAKKLIAAAKKSGADAVKFQAFKTEELIIKEARKAAHVKGKKSFFEMIKSWELTPSEYVKLAKFAKAQKIIFFASVFDKVSLKMLEKIKTPLYKTASSDLNNIPLLQNIAKTKKPVIMSTGMGDMAEIKQAVKIFEKSRSKLGIMHCVSLYPPKAPEFHLEKISMLKTQFPHHTIGYSDHSLDIFVPASSIVLGARIIEKHFTLSKKMAGPDQQSSADPKEMTKLVQQIRYLEEAVNENETRFLVSPRERKMRAAFRRSLVLNQGIEKGKIIRKNMLAIKRPGTGIPPTEISKVAGKRAKKTLLEDRLIKFSDLK